MSKKNGHIPVNDLEILGLPKGRKFYLSVEIFGNNKQFDVQVVEKGKLKISLNKSIWIFKTEKLFVGQVISIPANIFTFSGLAKVNSILIRQRVNNSDKSNDSSEENEGQGISEKVEDLSKIASYSYNHKPFNVHISHQNPFK